MKYSNERREAMLRKMLPPHNMRIPELAKTEGIPAWTLYEWRRRAQLNGQFPSASASNPEQWPLQKKFRVVLEVASMSEAEVAEYCRKQGLYPEQMQAWEGECEQVFADEPRRWKDSCLESRKQQRKLERALLRKDKALAEAAALLILQKKVQAIWEDDAGD